MEKKKEKKREYENITEVNYIYPERILRKLEFRISNFDILHEIYRSYSWRIFFFFYTCIYFEPIKIDRFRIISNSVSTKIKSSKNIDKFSC